MVETNAALLNPSWLLSVIPAVPVAPLFTCPFQKIQAAALPLMHHSVTQR